jgi:hypothetical protein
MRVTGIVCWRCVWLAQFAGDARDRHSLLEMRVTGIVCWRCVWLVQSTGDACDWHSLLEMRVTGTVCCSLLCRVLFFWTCSSCPGTSLQPFASPFVLSCHFGRMAFDESKCYEFSDGGCRIAITGFGVLTASVRKTGSSEMWRCFPTFRRIVAPSYSGSKPQKRWIFKLKLC